MKHYDIEGQDNLQVPIVTTRPTFSSEYSGKLIYESSTGKLLYGGSSSWTEAGGAGGNVQSLLYNSDFSVWRRANMFDTYGQFPPVDGQCTADRWILLSDGDNIVMTWRTDDDRAKTEWVMQTQANVSNKQFGYLQIIPWTETMWLRGKKVSFRLKAKSSSGIENIRVGIFALHGWYSPYTLDADIVDTWAGNGTNPTWTSMCTLINEPENFNTQSSMSWKEYKEEGILIPTYFDGEPLYGLAVFIWVDDTAIPMGSTLHLSEVDLVFGDTFTEPTRRPYFEELTRCRYFFEENYGYDSHIGDIVATANNMNCMRGSRTTSIPPDTWYAIQGFQYKVPKFYRAPTVTIYHPEPGYGTPLLNYAKALYGTGGLDIPIAPVNVKDDVGVGGMHTIVSIPSGAEVLFMYSVDCEYKKA